MAWLEPAGFGYVGGVAVPTLLATGPRLAVLDDLSAGDLAGLGDPHVALTSDHSLSPLSAPRFLNRLATQAVRSAFFLLRALAGGSKSPFAALPRLLHHCAQRSPRVGRLSEHGGEAGG